MEEETVLSEWQGAAQFAGYVCPVFKGRVTLVGPSEPTGCEERSMLKYTWPDNPSLAWLISYNISSNICESNTVS